jgi:DNA-binding transcriptional MerR regulator
MMNEPNTYTLEEIARDFDLTPRTARHYIENVLPSHHKTGRGKLARYGRDTWNCFSFIQRVRQDAKLSAAQLCDVLARLDQDQINRVAEGREELAIYIAPDFSAAMKQGAARSLPRASMRASSHTLHEPEPDFEMVSEMALEMPPDESGTFLECLEFSDEGEVSESHSWQDIYADDRLRISYQGVVSSEKREQLELAAELIKKILLSKG